ncbi:hypothetical protein IT072_13850 [Leifsonia sp. ZF2019]|uniref:hypothetical protein n=1 Tax=Leifsonia sp. ZF2019 TaxID=2781978 RepID=UPI001CBAB938|nr:hypothetical protein [Leifsonia sp. ZF2019]UAJ78341.1 hypothetical protein IT072_13850 [Leifsonia sp. ZF2019]
MNRNKRRGTAFETLITRALQNAFPDDDRIDRAPLRGAKDEGDIRGVRSPFGRVVIECKNHNRLELSQWCDEAQLEKGNADAIAGVVVHKRRGKGQALDQYVTMTVRDLIALLGGETS